MIIPKEALAIYDPLSVPNNKYGIHIVDENDLENAASLVNSTGGDWGYVTMVMRKDDRNLTKWQKIFDQMRSLHLIPLIRLATIMQNDIWQRPDLKEASIWAKYLNNLEWPIKNRYVILFNEPNHAKEWGGIVDPESYANVFASYSAELKKQSEDFFVLAPGLDASAPKSFTTTDEETFLRAMLKTNPNFFDQVDGWVSHSYPNPGYRGNSNDQGKGTIRTFLWEKELLNKLNIFKNLPIFITETGWPHQEGLPANPTYFSADDIPPKILESIQTAWQDENIVAITPFILNYQSYPFSHFSWQKYGSNDFYPQFYAYQSLSKIKGEPMINYNKKQENVLGLNSSSSSDLTVEKKGENILNYLLSKSYSLFLSLTKFISSYI